ncbi:MAG TPA: PVC-type heme-binding CxxCH protein, partial [Gemmataceae bacterium]|nr:PVC-type heme-binding CxxCH protein [Gemmataceae bacterium]
LNTVSPRFYTEIFDEKTAKGNFLTADSSVFNLLTPDDPSLPRHLVLDPDGQEKFRKYVPKPHSFMNTIENYPYPYVIDRLCWEFPCMTPSDWEAQNRFKPGSPELLRDWKAALDATVLKQGTMTLVFHPYGWSTPQQLVDLVDYADRTYGKRVKFLTFKEAVERLTKNVLAGQPLRDDQGEDNGVRLLDVNDDGYIDVVIGNQHVRQTRVWSPKTQSWQTAPFPTTIVSAGRGGQHMDAGVRFGIVGQDGYATMLQCDEDGEHGWHWNSQGWQRRPQLVRNLVRDRDKRDFYTTEKGRDQGVRLRDVYGRGDCSLIVGNPEQNAVFNWSREDQEWQPAPFNLPASVMIVDDQGRDNGLRFVDVDQDGRLDVLMSNEKGYALYLFTSEKQGWSRKVLAGRPGDVNALPMITRHGVNNGAAFHDRQLWVQNEDTSRLPNLIDVRSFNDLLARVEPTAKTPEASLRCLKVRPGFKAELVVSEPLVKDCIAYAWGPDGKLWVVEMGDYPLGADGHGSAGGRIKFLESTHHDGHYDKATLFMDGLHYPTGVAPWRKGVLVTCAPDIFYAEDTNGDGRAHKKVVLYTGLVEGNPQHRVNSLVWGLDNWIHCANGNSGGVVRSLKTGKTVDIHGRDFRIRPDTGDIEPEAGETQYGRSRNDWGDWFGDNNSFPSWHVVLDDHYLRRNPHVAAPNPTVQVSVKPGAARVYPISRTMPRFNDPEALNHFTSANSVIVYRDDLFGPFFAGNTFVSEPVHNLVHREIMKPRGVTFTSHRAPDEQESEFLASSDNWTRPCMIQIGPDGTLWMADMYRFVIEHPEWIPLEWQRRLDLRAGADMGRIYRIYPVDKKPRAIPNLDRLDTAGLVAALDSPSGWQRDMAQQMLLWRADRSAVPLLERLASESHRPLARLHALCTLAGLHGLTTNVLLKALADPHPGVRRHAIRLCEGRFSQSPELGERLLQLLDDADPHVRMQLAYTVG